MTERERRSAETIIADWLLGFVGGTDDLDGQRPNAATVIRWLRDEGWEITRIPPPASFGFTGNDTQRLVDRARRGEGPDVD